MRIHLFSVCNCLYLNQVKEKCNQVFFWAKMLQAKENGRFGDERLSYVELGCYREVYLADFTTKGGCVVD